MADWDSFDGKLALRGVDPRDWTIRRMLNAAEYQILSSARDEKEAAKLRAKLYPPERPVRTSARPTPRRPAPGQQTTADILAMVAAQDGPNR